MHQIPTHFETRTCLHKIHGCRHVLFFLLFNSIFLLICCFFVYSFHLIFLIVVVQFQNEIKKKLYKKNSWGILIRIFFICSLFLLLPIFFFCCYLFCLSFFYYFIRVDFFSVLCIVSNGFLFWERKMGFSSC